MDLIGELERDLVKVKRCLKDGNYQQAEAVADKAFEHLSLYPERLYPSIEAWYRANFNMVVAECMAKTGFWHRLSEFCYMAVGAQERITDFDPLLSQKLGALARYNFGLSYLAFLDTVGYKQAKEFLDEAAKLFTGLPIEGDMVAQNGRLRTVLLLAYIQLETGELADEQLKLLQNVYDLSLTGELATQATLAAYLLVRAYGVAGKRDERAAWRRRLRSFCLRPPLKLDWFALRLWANRPPKQLFNPKDLFIYS